MRELFHLEHGISNVSWNQSQLLTVMLLDGESAAYNVPIATWLDGRLEIKALSLAMNKLVQ